MKEIRWHGRGGQGAKTVSQVLAQINLREGKYVQAFPEFGPERSGAPIRAYNRISDEEIRVHSAVYSPDIAVVVDESLLTAEKPIEGLHPNGTLVVNTSCSAEEIRRRTGFKGRVVVVDADRIGREAGTGFANIPMLGAVAAVLGTAWNLVEEEVRRTMGERISNEMLDKNIAALRVAYETAKKEVARGH
ncbi:MAG: Pyruvate:ferredoxin oxidoreductase, gamma subunit [Candidatus Bipolaricaulis sibiricus]|uniref:Pyruvate:ferredoxin oxidoreductase, gamma subunit n=1 Tax=Bipolaricaulis sibiricus TaxID=2501609 RepID=A0A410FVP9_BIPS1|nr:MAG: Pyruvate:ferredoxin oxidoreductase, gamma subunit [Candidatus Bipolaricaulis sibiricus]